jgi:hypothetical protein
MLPIDHDIFAKDVTLCHSNVFKQSCQVQKLINDGTTIILLAVLANPQSNTIEKKFYLKDFKQSDSQKVLQLD